MRGNKYFATGEEGVALADIVTAAEAIQAIQAIDGGGDLQKNKEQLELIKTASDLIVTSQAAIEPDVENIRIYTNGMYTFQGVDGGGDLQKVKEELELIKTAIQIMDDWDDSDYCKIVPPLMITDSLIATGDAGTDTIAAPGAGQYIEVLGYQITEHHDAALAITASAKLKFETSGKQLWVGASGDIDVLENLDYSMQNIRVKGNANEALTLTNIDWVTPGGTVQAIIFYRIV